MPLSNWRAVEGQESAKTEKMKLDGEASNSPFKHMAKKYRVTESQLLLRWGIENGYPVIPKTTNPERMLLNLDLFNFSIDKEDLDKIALMNRDASVAWQVGDPSELVS